ncbi:MAG TPA: MFS transporter, partial [Capsulimonadaceae bacterium]|nr:MFS transporter [Capsulimonadaceae bacterium]
LAAKNDLRRGHVRLDGGVMGTKQRIVFWIWLMMVVAYLDRVNITLAGPVLSRALHLSPSQFGFVLSSFTLGYALMQVPGGYLADRLGARPLLVAALAIWSAFTALTAAAWSFVSLAVIRVLFGFGEGVENGAQFKLIGDHFDSRARSSANALFLTAIALGPAVAAPLSTWLIRQVGWRGLFLVFAGAGLVVALLMALFLPRPTDEVVHTEIADDTGVRAGWKAVIRRPVTWLAFFAYLFFNVAFWGFLGWMPTYLNTTRHIKLADLGYLASVPYFCGFLGMVLIGQLGARALYRSRAALIGVSYLVSAGFLYTAYSANTVVACVAGLSLAGFFLYGGFGPFWAITLDNIPDDLRGAFTGFVNLGGQIGGFFAPIVVGEIVQQTKSFTGGFLFMIAALVLASISLFLLQATGRRQTALA